MKWPAERRAFPVVGGGTDMKAGGYEIISVAMKKAHSLGNAHGGKNGKYLETL